MTASPRAPRDADGVEATVRAGGLIAGDRPLVVLFSGGRDSTCLLDLAVRIAGAGRVSALHVDYGLRPGSGDEAEHCLAVGAALGVSLTVVRAPTPPGRGNRQAWARELRYAAARRLAAELGGADVAAAHTASDQIETVLLRLISAPSRRALLGMAPRSGDLVRPLLAMWRAETTRYCHERTLPWVDDPSNAADTYVRNRIRNEVVPLLEALHPGAATNVLRLAEVLRDEAEIVDEQILDDLAGRSELPLELVRDAPRGRARLLVQHLADAARGDGRPAAGVAGRLEDIRAMGPDANLDLPSGVRAVTRGGRLGFERTPPLGR